MSDLKQTVFHSRHQALGAKMAPFAGWEMPIQYEEGIVAEHLATRRFSGLFDVSHMGRFVIRGPNARPFLQYVLTNNAESLDSSETGAQYTFIPNAAGGAIDDAYLYRFTEDEYTLVVNASNRQKDWDHFQEVIRGFEDVELTDRTHEIVMLALQGPSSRSLLEGMIESGSLPSPMRNAVSTVQIGGLPVTLARTGYTGEPICFELFASSESGPALWDLLVDKGATPVGLGARDSLRLEAGLPLYGHELGTDPEGREIPIMACPLSKFAVSFSPLKGDFIGREALAKQHRALERIIEQDYSRIADLPRRFYPVALLGRGIARQGARIGKNGKQVGFVGSGTMVPYWIWEGQGLASRLTDKHDMRSICLAYLDSDTIEDDRLQVEVRGREIEAAVVKCHLRSEAPPYARAILYEPQAPAREIPRLDNRTRALDLLEKAIANTKWRQEECINLIPSEMSTSPMTRLLSILDPSFRYAEHKDIKAFCDQEIFYYQGTDFIAEVEKLLGNEIRRFLGCRWVELRAISGQMANTAVFSAMADYINRADRRCEPRRIRKVMNHYLGRGGHLSAQPMGALRDYVARDPHTERPAVVAFPVRPENPYKVDVPATQALIEEHRPELIIFGKSMVLHKEPVAEVCRFLAEQRLDSVVMYDMAHVLGLAGPHFQEPFREGAHVVTGSTHKTFFGTQRGVIGSNYNEHEAHFELWEAVRRRVFPGSVSNHHLGTLLGLLMAAYELNHFKDEYQAGVIANAKAFARALHDCGLKVAGDPGIGFTETHQVVVEIGYGRGAEIARRLEENNIICNYQALPDEEGFTAAGALRLGVAEMTRFGMGGADFRELAPLMCAVVKGGAKVVEEVKALRSRFRELRFCFKDGDFDPLIQRLHRCL